MAAFLLLRPIPVSVASARGPGVTEERRHVVAQLRSGTLVATVTWAVDDGTSLDVLAGRIEYRPDGDSCSCSRIRFIQIAKTERNGGFDYDWQGLEEHRNILRTSSQTGGGIQGGYFVDHKASACAPRTPCSPYYRDHWPIPGESGDASQAGPSSAPASLVDYPFGWDVLEQISLESCARCVETGEFLGCAEWGARWPAQGPRTVSPIRVRETPSPTFLAALGRFEDYYKSKSHVIHVAGVAVKRLESTSRMN